jgi:hypothetical protein
VGFVVDKVALGQVSSEYFGFPCQSSFHQLLHSHLSSGAGTIGQKWPQYKGLSPTPLAIKKTLVSTLVRFCNAIFINPKYIRIFFFQQLELLASYLQNKALLVRILASLFLGKSFAVLPECVQ